MKVSPKVTTTSGIPFEYGEVKVWVCHDCNIMHSMPWAVAHRIPISPSLVIRSNDKKRRSVMVWTTATKEKDRDQIS